LDYRCASDLLLEIMIYYSNLIKSLLSRIDVAFGAKHDIDQLFV
jgi:hypothetical protein